MKNIAKPAYVSFIQPLRVGCGTEWKQIYDKYT